jgi:predicted nucleotide-binding protein (sugar kinase/HSP70/actin superfamily)
MMSGLAQVLPLNIWTYVVQESNLARLGKRFVLQGGTQKNLAAVKAQVDFFKRKVPGAQIFVHKYADIGGAIGAALETLGGHDKKTRTEFIGIDAASKLQFTSTNDETTRCSQCANKCRRTFVDIESAGSGEVRRVRFISGYGCEKGSIDVDGYNTDTGAVLARTKPKEPDLSIDAANLAFSDFNFEPLPKPAKCAGMTVGIPRLLNLFFYAPLFTTYFRTLGLKVVTSGFTNDRLWSEGNKWGAIDPCFPAKVAPAHVWQLLNSKNDSGGTLNAICFPIITHLESCVKDALGNTACAIQMGTTEVVEAVFTRDRDLFREKNIAYWKPALNLERAEEGCERLFEYFGERLGITREENAWAYTQGQNAMKEYLQKQRVVFSQTKNRLIDNDKTGLLLIGHPYHHDPGLNHRIPEEFSKRGYPIFTIESLPADESFLHPLFPEGGEYGIGDVWMRNFNRNTNQKVWAARIAARHPNLAVIDLSSFKCGHDAPTYNYIDLILDVSETPNFTFHDIDQNRPGATFKIRIDTIDYFLQEYERNLPCRK